jgi:hypothetical protein
MVLCVHIEPLVRGRRVAILGDATIELPELLSDRGARLVHAYDPDPARAAEALARAAKNRSPQGPLVSYAAFEGDLGVRDGAFDVVVIPDLSLFTDPADLLRRARRLVPTSGAVVVASPNPETKARLVGASPAAPAPNPAAAPPTSPKEPAALGYYELFDVVSLQFPVVRMIGQAPFVGYTIADFAQGGEPSVNVDTSLLEATEQPEWFIAVGSERPVALDEFSVIQIPLSDLRSSSSAARGEAAMDAEDRLALIEARARLALLTTELEELRERSRAEARDVEAREKSAAAMSARIVELSAELEGRDARLKESQSRAGDAHVRAERLVHQIGDLEEELRRQRDRATKLTKQLDDEKRARTKADMELAMIRNKPELTGARDRLQELSAELEAARSRIADLEMEQLSTVRGRASSVMPPATTPPTAPIPAPAPDPGLVARVSELEIALQDARRSAAEAVSARALADRRAEEIAAALDAERRAGTDLRAKAQSLESERAALQAKSAELTRRASELERRSADLEKQVADLTRQNAELTTRNEALERRVAEALRAQDEAAAAVIPDLASTEEVLRERGRLITSLQRDLRESERIGRELVEELEALRQGLVDPESPPAPRASATSAESRELIDDLRARLDTLAARGAKSEADLQAASWRIAQLERELADAHGASADPSAAAIHGLSAARE